MQFSLNGISWDVEGNHVYRSKKDIGKSHVPDISNFY